MYSPSKFSQTAGKLLPFRLVHQTIPPSWDSPLNDFNSRSSAVCFHWIHRKYPVSKRKETRSLSTDLLDIWDSVWRRSATFFVLTFPVKRQPLSRKQRSSFGRTPKNKTADWLVVTSLTMTTLTLFQTLKPKHGFSICDICVNILCIKCFFIPWLSVIVDSSQS